MKVDTKEKILRVKLISVTPNAENIIGYCARVSNPANQDNPDVSKLLSYCIKYGHWSIFEMANMVVEIETTRGIAAQILRHRSFSFQEFSQRYAEALGFEYNPPRRQDKKNRQNSLDDLSDDDKDWYRLAMLSVQDDSERLYKKALEKGIAKECARFLLPLSTKTRMYMNGTVRSWIHYIKLRTDPSTQKEHRDIAEEIKSIFNIEFPITAEALDFKEVEDE
jgi:thymidylate synthase (FAD)|tara:strand:+ start:181 stop:846 length:666 start_codon:yes stop_codon:yes gene_type:complete